MNTGIVWLRNTLRLNDNRVLIESIKSANSELILPLYILNKNNLILKNNNNRITFLYESLIDLDARFRAKFGINLTILEGNSEEIFRKLIEHYIIKTIYNLLGVHQRHLGSTKAAEDLLL